MINTSKLSEHDQELIKKARALNCIHHYEAEAMSKEAESDEAKEELKSIARSLYHKEEGITYKIKCTHVDRDTL